MRSVCVLGGGLAGLSAAHYAVRKGVEKVVLLESSQRLGGWINSSKIPEQGVILESGPRTIRPAGEAGANTLALVEELGLASKVKPVKYGQPSSSNRLILVDGNLHKLPNSLSSLFRKLPPFSRPLILLLAKDLFTRKTRSTDVSLHEFISRRFGSEVAEFLINPLVRGICAGDSRDLSVHFIASWLHTLEQKYGRVILGLLVESVKDFFKSQYRNKDYNCKLTAKAREEKWAVWGLEGGLETFIKALENSLEKDGVEMKKGVIVERLDADGGVVTVDGSISCDHVVLALPAFQAAHLLRPFSPDLHDSLSSIPFVDVAVVNLVYRGQVLDHEGFGFLVPSSQPQPILGCIYDTCTFPQGRDLTVFTVMLGGAWYEQVVGSKTEGQVGELAVSTLTKVLGIDTQPLSVRVSSQKQCIAQYTVGHRQRVAKARDIIARSNLPFSLVGSSYDGVGINDTILSSKKAVDLI